MPDLAKQRDFYLCATCGTQFRETAGAPEKCPICLDERQYVGPDGQAWTTLAAMRQQGFTNVFSEEEPGVFSILTEPKFGIGERAFLIRTPAGNILWDCVSFIDDATITAVKKLGPLSAIAISHPHYYTSMVEWSAALGDVPIHLHAADREWVQRPDAAHPILGRRLQGVTRRGSPHPYPGPFRRKRQRERLYAEGS